MISSSFSSLKRLEAESIYIMREVIAEFENPAMLYSIGKDSSVMLHLALNRRSTATRRYYVEIKEMIGFRDQRTKEVGMELLVYSIQKAKR